MSGTRLTRKVTVEGSKKLPDGGNQSSASSSGTRRSVFDRLGPGTSERSRPREPYLSEKCRNWLRDGRCQFGRNCKFLHGPFSETKPKTKSVRSIVRTDVDRSEGDDGTITVRNRSLDSLEAEEDEEKDISILKKKKHRSTDDSSEPSKKSEKVKRRQQIKKDSSEGEGDGGNDHRKRKKKVRKRQLSGGVVVTKTESPEQEERHWGDEDYEEERSDLEWEERGELDYERQLNLEKRRQDLQRQLALMDEEDALREKAERKVKDVKKERDEDLKPVIPVVHSKLHPEKSSVSPADEFSPVSSQSTPKKKKKKAEGEGKKMKTKRKMSPSTKELKKRKGVKPVAESSNGGVVKERPKKVTDVSPEKPKASVRAQPEFEETALEKPRVPKNKKQVKPKQKEGQLTRSSGDTYSSPSGPAGHRAPRTPPTEEIPREKRSVTPEEQRMPLEKLRRRTALSSPEGTDSPAPPYGSESRTRRNTDPPDGSPRKTVREVHINEPPGEAEYKIRAKGQEKPHRKEERSPGTPEHGRRMVAIKDTRHVEEGRSERRKKIVDEEPPRSPSPEDFPARDPITPPEEQRRHRTPPPRGDRRGPQTPPGEPDYDDAPKQGSSDQAPPRHRGPYTPPLPSNPSVRNRDERNREEFHDGRSEVMPYRDEASVPRSKERPQRDVRYSRQRGDDGVDDTSRGSRSHAPVDEDYTRGRGRDEELARVRHRNERQDDYHQRNRPKDDRADDFHRVRDREPERSDDYYRSRVEEPRGGEPPRRKLEVDEEYLRRREDRDDDHLRARNREVERDDERSRRRDDRNDDNQRGRVREEHEDDMQRPRGGRDFPRRPFEGGDERHWERHGERDNREMQFGDRDRRRPDMPRQDMSDNRSRERPGERPRDRDGRYPPPGPDYHRRSPPIPHGSRRSPPPHGPSRGPHRFEERRRSLSPGGRREEGYRQGPPRDQGGYGMGREPAHGRGGHSTPFDNRSRPVEGRRRISPPPRQFAERGRGAPRGRGIRGGRGFPDRSRPPGDRYQDSPRDRVPPWDPERRRERDHPRDRNRPHDESRDRDRRPRGELSPVRGPRHWEDRRAGSPGRVVSPSRDRRVHEQEKIPREAEEERRRRSDEEEDEEWEYEEDLGDDKDQIPRQGERKRPRETGSSISTIESPVGGKKRRSETPEMEVTPVREVPEGIEKQDDHEKDVISAAPVKQTAKPKKKKVGKKGKGPKLDGEPGVEVQVPYELPAESEESPEGEKPVKVEKKPKKEKGKTKEKVTKKKKKNTSGVAPEPPLGIEKKEEQASITEESGVASSENLGEVTQQSEEERIPKVTKKRRHPAAPEGEEAKVKGSDKPPKKKKKKKHQPEVVVQPWADLEDEEEETVLYKSEGNERQSSVKDGQLGQAGNIEENKSSDAVAYGRKETGDAPIVEESVEVFSDWSDDSPIGDDAWSDVNEPEISESKPKTDDKVRSVVTSPSPNEAPTYDDVYDPISDDELDAMLGDDEEDDGAGIPDSKGPSSVPMAVEDVDWSALVSAQNTSDKTGEEPGAHLKRFTPGHVFSRIGISSSLAGPRLTKLVQKAAAEVAKDKPSVIETVDSSDVDDGDDSQVANSFGALMAGAAAKRRERRMLFTDVGPCRRALCARRDLGMRKRLRRLTGKVGLFQVPSSAPVDNELYSMSVALYKHEHSAMDSPATKLIPSRMGAVLATVNS